MDPNDLDLFASWLKQRREALDLTQKELADATDCSVSTIRKMEMGLRRPSKQIAELLATNLEIAPEEYGAFMQFARSAAPTQRKHQLPALPGTPPYVPSATSVATPQTQSYGTTRAQRATAQAWPPTNLPTPLTSFVGRGQIMEQIRSLLWRSDVRLLTLTGPPGIGKTRISIECASGLVGDFTDGVFLVSLAPISDPAQVLPAIAESVEMPQNPQDVQEGKRPLAVRLAHYLRGKGMLLVLDNFEQVTEAGPDIAHLLTSAGRLKVLATSRVPLHISGEHEVVVPPLDLPGKEDPSPLSVDELRQFEAIQLFVRRARMANADFSLTDDNMLSVLQICRQLDGLALAIELAAARVKMHSPQALSLLLSGHLLSLTGGAQDLPARHQTLRNAIDWSYDLLDDGERQLFRRLAIFQGGSTLRAIGGVCNFDGQLAMPVAVGVEMLTGKSLLTVSESLQQREGDDHSGQPRFGMLETIHEYAWEKLVEAEAESASQKKALREAHARYFLGLAEEARPYLNGNDPKVWLDTLEEEYANIRAAFSFLLEETQGESYAIELVMRLVNALSRFWYMRGNAGEGRNWLDAALSAQDLSLAQINTSDLQDIREGLSLRGRILSDAGLMAWAQSDFAATKDYYAKSLAIGRQLGDNLQVARALNNLGMVATEETNFAEAHNYYKEALQIAQELGETVGVIKLLNNLGVIAHKQSDYSSARHYYERSLELRRSAGDIQGTGFILTNIASMALNMGELTTAEEHYTSALEIGRELGDKHTISRALIGIGDVSVRSGDYTLAGSLYRESLLMNREIDSKIDICETLEGLTHVAAFQNDPVKAAYLYGAADGLRTLIAALRNVQEQEYLDLTITETKKIIGETEWHEAWAEGQAQPLSDAIKYALEEIPSD